MNTFENPSKNENPETNTEWDFSKIKFAGDKGEPKAETKDDSRDRPPEHVYRGVHVTPKIFFEIDFNDDIVPPNPPKINEEGMETVEDGNEYGVYMTDYLDMVKTAYGNPDHQRGEILNRVQVGREELVISEPAIGVIYKIDTSGTDIHKPWITPSLKGHYNNGFSGNEWVTKRIPKENYTVYSIRMGRDLLHDSEDVSGKSQEEIRERYNERMNHLEKLNLDLDKLPLDTLPSSVLKTILKDIYGDDGAAYYDTNTTDLKTVKDGKKKLLAFAYHGDDGINLRLAKRVEDLTTGIDESKDYEKLLGRIEEEIQGIERRKTDFVQRKKAEGVTEPNIASFIKQQNEYKRMLDILESRSSN